MTKKRASKKVPPVPAVPVVKVRPVPPAIAAGTARDKVREARAGGNPLERIRAAAEYRGEFRKALKERMANQKREEKRG